jgi:hypothetical protein
VNGRKDHLIYFTKKEISMSIDPVAATSSGGGNSSLSTIRAFAMNVVLAKNIEATLTENHANEDDPASFKLLDKHIAGLLASEIFKVGK